VKRFVDIRHAETARRVALILERGGSVSRQPAPGAMETKTACARLCHRGAFSEGRPLALGHDPEAVAV
jgi:hypothetical protein